VPALERVEAIVENRAIYELAALIPEADHTHGGRRRQYPEYMWLIYEALLSVYGSARQVEAELSHPTVWGLLRDRALLGQLGLALARGLVVIVHQALCLGLEDAQRATGSTCHLRQLLAAEEQQHDQDDDDELRPTQGAAD